MQEQYSSSSLSPCHESQLVSQGRVQTWTDLDLVGQHLKNADVKERQAILIVMMR